MVCRMFKTWWYWLSYAAFGCRKNSFHRNQASEFRCKNSLIFWRPQCKTLIEIWRSRYQACVQLWCAGCLRYGGINFLMQPSAAARILSIEIRRPCFGAKIPEFFGDREVKLWLRFWRKKLAKIEWKSSKFWGWAWKIDWEFLETIERKNGGRNYAMRRWSETCEYKEVSMDNTYRKMW